MQTKCGFGHLYDSDLYATCPYCNRNARSIVFGPDGAGRTGMPGNHGGGTIPSTGGPGTIPPTGGPGGSARQRSSSIGPTELPEELKKKMEKEKKNRTVGIFEQKYGLDPVVGWLVCIEGPEKGRDYRLFDRINSIGRDETNDVVIASEQTLSLSNHARLAYDAKHNNFQMIPGEGRNITYLNDAPLYVPQMLHAYDVIEFGETKLLFIPLCNDKFQWKQEAKG